MKRNVPVIFTLFITLFYFSGQAQNLYGFVLEQNSGKKPVEGVRLKSTFGANQVTTAQKGDYTLTFQDGRPGKSVMLFAEKENWVITDKEKLAANLPEDPFNHPHVIIMCRKDVWEKQNKDYKSLLEKYIKQSYEKEKAALDKLDKQYQRKIDSLQEKFTRLEKELNELAELYSRTNMDDLAGIERKAYDLFKEEKIDECIALRKSLDSEKNFLKTKGKERQLDSLSRIIDTALLTNKNEQELHKRNLREEARLAQLKYDFKTAEEKLGFLALYDSADFNNAFDFAYFLANQNKHDTAIYWYRVCLRKVRELINISPAAYEHYAGMIQNNLGSLYSDKNNYPAAEASLLEALEIRGRLSKLNPSVYEPGVAMTKMNLGNLYLVNNNYPVADKAYHDALQIYQRLTSLNPAIYEPYVAITNLNLGNLYFKDKNNYPAAEAAFLKALEIYLRLASAYPATYEPYAGMIQNNLGVLYYEENNYKIAEKALLQALEIRKRLAKLNPAAYEQDVAMTKNNLGNLYFKDKNNYKAAEAAYLEALTIYQRLAKLNPDPYEPDVARTQNNLGVLYRDNKNYPSAKETLLEALKIYQRFAKVNPATYEPYVAVTQNNLGILYRDNKNYPSAEEALLEALKIYQRLTKLSPAVYEPEVAKTQNNLGVLYKNNGNYRAAEAGFFEALKIYQRLAKLNPATYEPDVANTQAVLGFLYSDSSDYPAAETAYLGALAIYKKLATLKPEIYNPDICRTIVLIGYLQKNNFKENRQPFIDSIFDLAKTILSVNKQLAGSHSYLASIQSLEETFYPFKKLIRIKQLEQKISNTPKYGEKIEITLEIVREYQSLVDSGYTRLKTELGSNYGSLAWYQLFEKKFADAERSARESLDPHSFKKNERYDSAMTWVNTNLALALLFQGKYNEAEKIYLSLKNKPYGKATYKETFLADLDELEKAGITHKDVEKIRALLKQ